MEALPEKRSAMEKHIPVRMLKKGRSVDCSFFVARSLCLGRYGAGRLSWIQEKVGSILDQRIRFLVTVRRSRMSGRT